jgi:HAMP domain-containing protein
MAKFKSTTSASTAKKEVSLDLVFRARRSVRGRLNRLRKVRSRWSDGYETPIQEIGVFEEEISEIEENLKKMAERIENATILI